MSLGANNERYSFNGPVEAFTTVVVVGAGPSGLMLTCNLARFGIGVVLLDDRPDKTLTGKADGIQPKTIETLKQMRLADSLLKNASRVYDISLWQSTAGKPLQRTGRQTHYPEHLVGASDPYILLAHQGMLEEILIDDMESRGEFVVQNSKFVSCSPVAGTGQLDVIFEDLSTNTMRKIQTEYLVGCDGTRSKVRTFIPDGELKGEITNASWGVLDGIIETSFPDLWSKVVVRSHTAGSIIWIPRERGMTRLYVELSSADGEKAGRTKTTQEYVMARARESMAPYTLKLKTVEWFGNYVVGQRVATHFMDPDARIFIAGDAAHCHSALAAQGANTSMHDSFNLAWKLNLVHRGLANPSLLSTYEEERRKIATDLIRFDAEHCAAFEKGVEALTKNFDDNIRFISGIGAEYATGLLSHAQTMPTPLQPGALQIPAKATRYYDSNPVDIQLDIPLLGQFRVYFFVPDIKASLGFLSTLCTRLSSDSSLGTLSSRTDPTYEKQPRGIAPADEFFQFQRYTTVSNVFTFAMVTQSSRSEFELADLPPMLQASRWTLYLDDVETIGCTVKWFGFLRKEQVGIAIVRPDGYIGGIDKWDMSAAEEARKSIEGYFSFMLQ